MVALAISMVVLDIVMQMQLQQVEGVLQMTMGKIPTKFALMNAILHLIAQWV